MLLRGLDWTTTVFCKAKERGEGGVWNGVLVCSVG